MDVVTLFGAPEVAGRLFAATAAGAVLGINRELQHKPAGLRTHALVSMGSALLTLTALEFASENHALAQESLSRVIQGIVVGVGFIGGGAILRDATGEHVHGLTTAATVWLAAGLGIACGVGAWHLVSMAAALTIAVLVLGGMFETAMQRRAARARGKPPDTNGD